MTRSTELWEMSRSCQSVMSSSAATALPRLRRAMPLMRSQLMGLRLCGIADEPFCPGEKYSSASRISVRWRLRTSVAIFSSVEEQMAIVVTNSAWRSRWMTCVARRTGVRPSFSPTICSIFGSMLEYVPTAPESLQTETIFFACSTRSMSRSISALQSRSLRPNVIGSAWMPCVRPMHGVCLNSTARRRSTSWNARRSLRMMSQASRIIMQ